MISFNIEWHFSDPKVAVEEIYEQVKSILGKVRLRSSSIARIHIEVGQCPDCEARIAFVTIGLNLGFTGGPSPVEFKQKLGAIITHCEVDTRGQRAELN